MDRNRPWRRCYYCGVYRCEPEKDACGGCLDNIARMPVLLMSGLDVLSTEARGLWEDAPPVRVDRGLAYNR